MDKPDHFEPSMRERCLALADATGIAKRRSHGEREEAA
jgi:hypothetical protein